ncbi:MAG: hypothetical protein ACRDJC_19950, partial [Thermomicrobiales bacterium]
MATARFRPPRRAKPALAPDDAPSPNNDEPPPAPARASAHEREIGAASPGPFVRSDDNGAGAFAADHDGLGQQRRTKRVRAPRREGPRAQSDLVGKQGMQGHLLGDRYVRVCRVQSGDFERAAPGHLIATEEALEARGPAGRAFGKIKRA